MNTKKNIISSLLLQIVTIISGLVLPRLIITTFGSEVNGLVSTITQYLSIIAIIEGGLGAVVLSELYSPIENRNSEKIMGIYNVTHRFFKQIGFVFIVYTIVVGVAFPLLNESTFSFSYCCSLVFILSINTFVQYFFSITNRLIIEANQDLYICNYVSSISTIVNLLLTIILIHYYPEIHLVKLFSALAFLIQPIIFSHHVKKRGYIDKSVTGEVVSLNNRWSGFAQNLAHFINMNTDIIIISLFLNFGEVSVYTVYCMASNQLKSLISRVTGAYQSALGKYIAIGDKDLLEHEFDRFNQLTLFFSTILLSTCILLNTQFVQLYTHGVTDANYFRPVFSVVMGWAQFIFCIREPYRYVILSAGKFKETNRGSFLEAGINVVLTLIFIMRLGIVGAACGTLFAITYRYIYFIRYLNQEILNLRFKKVIRCSVAPFMTLGISSYMALFTPFTIMSITDFIVFGFASIIGTICVYSAIVYVVEKRSIFEMIRTILLSNKRRNTR